MEYLKQVPFFTNLSEDKLRKITKIAQEKLYSKGSIIFKENDPGDAFYVIKEGKVCVLKQVKEGIDSIIATLEKGDFFGEMALIEGDNRNATVEAVEDCQLIMIRRNEFQALIKLDDSIAFTVIKTLGSRLREMDKRTVFAEEDSIIDGLTNLFTHKYLKSYLEKETARSYEHGETFSLIMIDIDNFKRINDQHGHLTGDYVLKILSNLIRSNVHSGADVVARYGGEEIVIVLPETPKDQGILVAERICSLIRNFKFDYHQIQLKVTISLGVSNYPDDAENIKDLIGLADKAMYKAKKNGKDRVFYA
ncbi:GGDEF domain-containing protein [bacterium]|nr:GGDEF domain-containing protein [bacterium]MBU1782707.1 GGDEF domain-containing protein [bacterium]